VRTDDGVMTLLGVDAISTMIEPDFLAEFDLNPPVQYGIVCADVTGSIPRLESLGAGPFLHVTTKAPNWTERGRRKDCRVEFALGHHADAQIELLGAGEGTQFYAESIPGDGSFALHHAGIYQAGIDWLGQRLNGAGFDTAVQGGFVWNKVFSTRFAYFDTRDEIGCFLEILEYEFFGRHLPPGASLISTLGGIQSIYKKRGS